MPDTFDTIPLTLNLLKQPITQLPMSSARLAALTDEDLGNKVRTLFLAMIEEQGTIVVYPDP